MLSSNPQSNMLAVPTAPGTTTSRSPASSSPASVADTTASNISLFSTSTLGGAATAADDWASTASLPPSLINIKEPYEEHVMENLQLQEHHLIDHSTPASVPHSPTTQVPRTLVIALDGSSHSTSALAYASTHLLHPGDHVLLVNVRSIHALVLTDLTGASLRGLHELELANREAAHRLLADAGNWLKTQHPTVQVKAVAIRGEPRSDICRKAEDVDADMIVVGSRGLGALKRVVMGSVSEYVCNHAPCPVLIVRPKHCGKGQEVAESAETTAADHVWKRQVGFEPGPGEQGPSTHASKKPHPGEEVPVHLLSRAAEEE